PLDPTSSGVFEQLLQLKQVCQIQGLLLVDVPACAFPEFGCSSHLVKTLGLSTAQVIQHGYSINDLLLSTLEDKLKDKIRVTVHVSLFLSKTIAVYTCRTSYPGL
ncbi:mgc78790 related, partial [Cystoisospora suis]